jgi:Ca-activated chloride channel family protein
MAEVPVSLRFASPLFPWLPLATLVVLAVVFAVDFTRRRRLLDRIGSAPQLARMMASLSMRGRVVKAVLVVAAATLIALAAARPEIEGDSTWRKRGIDVVVVMDFSKSMLARDVYPSRLGRMVKEVDDLLDRLESDRVAVVAFAGTAAHFPLSDDHEAVRNLYAGLSPQDLPPGSDLGEALLVARCLVRPDLVEDPGCARVGGRGRGGAPLGGAAEAPAPPPPPADRSRVIVLFTDGEDTGNGARAQVEQAVMLGIHVYLVGMGTVKGELIPELDDDGNQVGWKKTDDGRSFVTTRLDQGALEELAEVAGGEGHYLENPTAKDVAGLLGQLAKGDLDARMATEWKSVHHWLLFPAFLLLVIEACLSGRRRRVLYPEEPS